MIKLELLLAVSPALQLHQISIYVSSLYMPRNELHHFGNFFLWEMSIQDNLFYKWTSPKEEVEVGWGFGGALVRRCFWTNVHSIISPIFRIIKTLGTYGISCPLLTDVTTATCQISTGGEFPEQSFSNPHPKPAQFSTYYHPTRPNEREYLRLRHRLAAGVGECCEMTPLQQDSRETYFNTY